MRRSSNRNVHRKQCNMRNSGNTTSDFHSNSTNSDFINSTSKYDSCSMSNPSCNQFSICLMVSQCISHRRMRNSSKQQQYRSTIGLRWSGNRNFYCKQCNMRNTDNTTGYFHSNSSNTDFINSTSEYN